MLARPFLARISDYRDSFLEILVGKKSTKIVTICDASEVSSKDPSERMNLWSLLPDLSRTRITYILRRVQDFESFTSLVKLNPKRSSIHIAKCIWTLKWRRAWIEELPGLVDSGLGPVKSRQDDLKYCKIREETNGMNFNNFFFERATALKTILPWKTTLSGRSHQSTHPKNPSFFLNLILISLVVVKVLWTVLINNVWNIKRRTMEKAKFEWDDDEEFFSSPEKFTPFSSPNQIKRWGLRESLKVNRKRHVL
ncbi:hypothetical protein TNCV_4117841 [Trichonephila clavipes]|nr:hypothetical protein TNCV_4117841 [Trichonephila clavipes]